MTKLTKTVGKAACAGLLLAILLVAGCATPRMTDGEAPCRIFGRMNTCAAVPLASDAANRAGRAFEEPPADLGRLYLMRPYKQEWKNRTRVYVDGNLVAALGPATYAVLDLRPGAHRIVFDSGERSELSAVVEAGKLYFGLYQARLWIGQVERSAQWISRDDAASALKSVRRVEPVGSISSVLRSEQ